MYVYRKCAISIHYHFNNSFIAAGVLIVFTIISQLYYYYYYCLARDAATFLFYWARCIVWRCQMISYVTSRRNVIQENYFGMLTSVSSGRITFVFVFSKSKSFPSNLHLDFSQWEWDYGLVCGTAGQQSAHSLTKFQLVSKYATTGVRENNNYAFPLSCDWGSPEEAYLCSKNGQVFYNRSVDKEGTVRNQSLNWRRRRYYLIRIM